MNTESSIKQIEEIIESMRKRGFTLGRFKGIARIALSQIRFLERSSKSKEKN